MAKNENVPGGGRRAIALCAVMERDMGALYRELAAAHAHDPAAQRLWAKTAAEEDNHASQFDLARLYGDELGEVLVTVEQATALVALVAEVRRRLAARNATVEEALQVLAEMEERLISFHMASAVTFASPQLRRLFESMMAADQDHVASLKQALAERAPPVKNPC
jgi:rubrerythrin